MDLFIKVIAVYVAVKWFYATTRETGANHRVIISTTGNNNHLSHGVIFMFAGILDEDNRIISDTNHFWTVDFRGA